MVPLPPCHKNFFNKLHPNVMLQDVTNISLPFNAPTTEIQIMLKCYTNCFSTPTLGVTQVSMN